MEKQMRRVAEMVKDIHENYPDTIDCYTKLFARVISEANDVSYWTVLELLLNSPSLNSVERASRKLKQQWIVKEKPVVKEMRRWNERWYRKFFSNFKNK